jgi:RND family efflux transporter MFP subunit
VATVRGTALTIAPRIDMEGSLAPIQSADLGFKVGGRLAVIRAAVGAAVKPGQLLASLDGAEAAAQARAAEASLRAAEAQVVIAADAASRTAKVVASGAQPESLGVQTTQQAQLAEAQRDAAKAQLALARQALQNHSLVAPFAGVVTKAPDGTGEVVGPGLALFHIADFTRLKLVGSVSAADSTLVQVGAEVTVQGVAGKTARGKVTAVVGALDERSKRVPVHAEIDNAADQNLIAGALHRATIAVKESLSVLSFPHRVLKPGSQDEVFVVTDGKLAARRVDFSVASDGSLLVRRGLAANEDVLADPWPEAKSGDLVRAGQ